MYDTYHWYYRWAWPWVTKSKKLCTNVEVFGFMLNSSEILLIFHKTSVIKIWSLYKPVSSSPALELDFFYNLFHFMHLLARSVFYQQAYICLLLMCWNRILHCTQCHFLITEFKISKKSVQYLATAGDSLGMALLTSALSLPTKEA